MSNFEVEWAMYGTAIIEADDPDEAEQILHDNLTQLDTSMFDQFDVDTLETTNIELVEQDAD